MTGAQTEPGVEELRIQLADVIRERDQLRADVEDLARELRRRSRRRVRRRRSRSSRWPRVGVMLALAMMGGVAWPVIHWIFDPLLPPITIAQHAGLAAVAPILYALYCLLPRRRD